jgi:hypothetical protein
VIVVDRCTIGEDGAVSWSAGDTTIPPGLAPTSWEAVRARVADLNTRFKHNFQGFMVKAADGRRWKIRTAEYNRIRAIRGNSPRRDYIWLDAWKNNTLREYLALFPEERPVAEAEINRWKAATTEVYRLYCDAFKARTLDRRTIPRKYKPLVYGLHSLFIETLKPAGKTVDWKACLEFMNSRQVPQMLYVMNYDFRTHLRPQSTAAGIPLEPPIAVGTQVDATTEAVEMTGHEALGAEAPTEAPADA